MDAETEIPTGDLAQHDETQSLALSPSPFTQNPVQQNSNRKPSTLQGYLAHKKTPSPLGPPWDPMPVGS